VAVGIKPSYISWLGEVRTPARSRGLGRYAVSSIRAMNRFFHELGTLLLLLLLTQAMTGPVLAGTDLFYPLIGAWIAEHIAAPGVAPATLVPYVKDMYDQTAY
jgi:hypothetical protein